MVGSTDLRVSPNNPALQQVVRAEDTVPLIKPSAPPDTAANHILLNRSPSISPFLIRYEMAL